jgi:hypothetical protein
MTDQKKFQSSQEIRKDEFVRLQLFRIRASPPLPLGLGKQPGDHCRGRIGFFGESWRNRMELSVEGGFPPIPLIPYPPWIPLREMGSTNFKSVLDGSFLEKNVSEDLLQNGWNG